MNNKIRTKQKKLADPIKFKDSTAIEDINRKVPISTKKYDIVNRIYDNYPLIPKWQIAIIVKSFYEIAREQSLLGYKINIRSIFNEFHIKVGALGKILASNATIPSIRKRGQL